MATRSAALRGFVAEIARKSFYCILVAEVRDFAHHLHFLATEGGTDEHGEFHKVRKFDDTLIAEFFSREVFSLLLQEQLISPELVEKILQWRHSGFNVHSKVNYYLWYKM